MSKTGMLKFADFGLARDLIPDRVGFDKEGREIRMRANYTAKVVTPLYRVTDNCLEEKKYDEKIDVWSTACVFGEILGPATADERDGDAATTGTARFRQANCRCSDHVSCGS